MTDAIAAMLLAGRPRPDALEALPGLRTWLLGLGAHAETIAGLEVALEAPPSLDAVFERAQALDMSVYLYLAATVTGDPRFPATALFADVVQARFELPTAIVRSVIRRYRR